MLSYAITGAAGHLGRLAVQELLVRGVFASDIVAVACSRDNAADLVLRGVEVRTADDSRPETVVEAL